MGLKIQFRTASLKQTRRNNANAPTEKSVASESEEDWRTNDRKRTHWPSLYGVLQLDSTVLLPPLYSVSLWFLSTLGEYRPPKSLKNKKIKTRKLPNERRLRRRDGSDVTLPDCDESESFKHQGGAAHHFPVSPAQLPSHVTYRPDGDRKHTTTRNTRSWKKKTLQR